MINYLDDYLFAALVECICNWQVCTFMSMCKEILLPVSLRKTQFAITKIMFLGFLVDSKNKLVLVPIDRFLNFLCQCVVLRWAFTRRLYAPFKPKLKPHHQMRITGEMKMDLRVWQQFLAHPMVFCRPFTDFSTIINATEIDFHTDSARKIELGCGESAKILGSLCIGNISL